MVIFQGIYYMSHLALKKAKKKATSLAIRADSKIGQCVMKHAAASCLPKKTQIIIHGKSTSWISKRKLEYLP